MRKTLATAAAALVAVGLLAGTAGTASAETLIRPPGVAKAVITAKGAPAGAKIVKAKVTVKKGKKTVAKKKNFYKAKAGTYKVTSYISYQPKNVVNITDQDITATCAVKSIQTTPLPGDPTDTTIYIGSCTDYFMIGGKTKTITWNTRWIDTDGNPPLKVGGVDREVYADELDTPPNYVTYGATKAIKKTRTVVVR